MILLADVDEAHIKGSFKLDPTKKPKTIDMTFPAALDAKEDQKVLGIYELEGDTLRLCYGPDRGKRPTELNSKAGSKRSVIVFKRTQDVSDVIK